MINQNEIITNKSSSEKIVSKSTSETSVNKEKPSLFDTLMSSNNIKKDNKTEVDSNSKNIKKEIKNSEKNAVKIGAEDSKDKNKSLDTKSKKSEEFSSNIKISEKDTSKNSDDNETKNNTKIVENKSPLSLLDRLILESKDSMKKNQTLDENKLSSSKKEEKIIANNKVEANPKDSKIKDLNEKNDLNKNIVNKNSTLDEKNDKTSKLDKLDKLDKKVILEKPVPENIIKNEKENKSVNSKIKVDIKENINTSKNDFNLKDKIQEKQESKIISSNIDKIVKEDDKTTKIEKTIKNDNNLSNKENISVVNEDKVSNQTDIKINNIKKENISIESKDIKKVNSDENILTNIKETNKKDNIKTTNKTEVEETTKINKNEIKKDDFSLFNSIKNSLDSSTSSEIKNDKKIELPKEINKKIEKLDKKIDLSESIIKNNEDLLKNNTSLDLDSNIEKNPLSEKKLTLNSNINTLEEPVVIKQDTELSSPKKTIITKTNQKDLEIKSNISEKDITDNPKELETNDKKESLMDKLLKENNTIVNKNEKNIKTIDSKSDIDHASNKNPKSFLTNIYLNTQKNTINNQALANKTEAIDSVKNAKSTKDVEKASDKLDLGLKEIKIEKDEIEVKDIVSKKVKSDNFEHRSVLDKLAFNKNIFDNTVKKINNNIIENASEIKTTSTTTPLEEVSVSVPNSLIQNMQLKIVAARQQMQSMMSDVAKKMYENYKPPVTAFRINLTPSNLGSISILMKNDRESGLNISMNISNSNTLDSFVENQNSLKSSLNKTFDEDTQFNLDFNSDDSSQSSNSNSDNNDREFNQKQVDTKTILESREDNLEKEEKDLDYM